MTMAVRSTAPLLALLLLAGSAPAGGPGREPDALSAAREAARWVVRQGIERTLPDGAAALSFPEYAESPGEVPAAPLYAGSAGVLLFLENAAAALDDPDLRKAADATARGLLHPPPAAPTAGGEGAAAAPAPAPASAALYTGEAGTAWALLLRHRLRGDAAALAGARRIADGLIARMVPEGDGASFDGSNDIIAGAAGTILLLLEAAETTGDDRYAAAAARAGRTLARRGIEDRAGPPGKGRLLRWTAAEGQATHYPNFSHGTAGVAYALARTGAATGDGTCREAALAGARWLLAHGKSKDGTLAWCHSLPGGANSFQEGWCHGPAGTGRLFLLLSAVTGEKRWLAPARAAGAWIRAERPEKGMGEGGSTRFYSPSLCCGAAGVLDFFLDLHRATGDPRDLAYARAVGRCLIRLSKADGDGRKWTNYDRPDGKGITYHGVSLMLGTSGEGMALLRLAAAEGRVTLPFPFLPDR